mmetsp:Transcript_26541/g.81600  ORF Transcript_26541/g.81600 Transcript_26541/m.81600 type:complete len:142 (+) Transcript_26541:1656-2081(+)
MPTVEVSLFLLDTMDEQETTSSCVIVLSVAAICVVTDDVGEQISARPLEIENREQDVEATLASDTFDTRSWRSFEVNPCIDPRSVTSGELIAFEARPPFIEELDFLFTSLLCLRWAASRSSDPGKLRHFSHLHVASQCTPA